MKIKTCLVTGAFTLIALGLAKAQIPYTTDANTLFLYHYNEGVSASTAVDSSGNSRNATYGTGVVTGTTSISGLSNAFAPAQNNLGRAYWTDPTPNGQNSFLYNVSAGSFTIEAWARLDSNFSGGNRVLASIQPTGVVATDMLFSILETGGSYYLALGDSGGPNRAWTSSHPITLQLGSWYHLAVTGAPTGTPGQWDYKFYYNQAGDSTTPTPLHSVQNTQMAPYSGSTNQRVFSVGNHYGNSGNDFFPGLIDEVRFSDVARTQFDTLAVPEPGSVLLIGFGLAAIAYFHRKRN